MLKTYPQYNFSLDIPDKLSKSRISVKMHCGILINMPYSIDIENFEMMVAPIK
mgnify:CR=1 FL=1